MTDNDIIKALECSIKYKCPECPYFHSFPCDKCRKMRKDALDLINRQNAEIERLKALQSCEDMDSCGVPCEVMKRIVEVELDKLNAEKNDVMHYKDQIKAEAIKEFAERLKERKYLSNEWSHGGHPYVVEEDDIDDVLEEMVGDSE